MKRKIKFNPDIFDDPFLSALGWVSLLVGLPILMGMIGCLIRGTIKLW